VIKGPKICSHLSVAPPRLHLSPSPEEGCDRLIHDLACRSPSLPDPDLVLPPYRLVSDTRESQSSEARPPMMHGVMQDESDQFGRSRARTPLRCDPLLGISLQALPTNPYMHPLWIAFTRRADLLWSSETADLCVLNGMRVFYLGGHETCCMRWRLRVQKGPVLRTLFVSLCRRTPVYSGARQRCSS
jgi:hypothetical protein